MSGKPRPMLNPDLQRIADGVLMGLNAMSFAARRSGRTTRMLERITPEHRIIVTAAAEREHIMQKARSLGVLPRKILVADPTTPLYCADRQAVIRDGTWPTAPDHTWVEQRVLALVLDALEQVQYELDQVDLPQTPQERAAQRQNYLARQAGVKPDLASSSCFDWGRYD